MQESQAKKPLLVGVLIDVSGSMAEQLRNQQGLTERRLKRVQESIDDLVIRARTWRDEHSANESRSFAIFVYGFGLGNLRDILMGRTVPPVANLLAEDPLDHCVVSSDTLLDNWAVYRNRIQNYTGSMLGATPMVEALETVGRLITKELGSAAYATDPLLLIISDGLPTDGGEDAPSKVTSACAHLKELGVIVLSCYITDEDLTMHRTLYEAAPQNWSPGARLMFDSASRLSRTSVLWQHLHEHNWTAPPRSKLFAQINQSEILSEFVEALLGPIEQQGELIQNKRDEAVVFVSYSHADREYVRQEPGSLLYYLRGLEHEGIRFWWDDQIPPGADWDETIREALAKADVAMVLVSQAFLSSKYCTDVEMESFIQRRADEGLTLIPVILSACEWERHEWLSATQALPRDGKNIESDYANPGQRKELYLKILKSIRGATLFKR